MADLRARIDAIKIPDWVVLGCLVVSIPLLFVGGPGYYAGRIPKLLWDLGHIPFMFFMGILLVWFMSRFLVARYRNFFAVYLCLIVIISIVTEGIQAEVGRMPSISDVFSDIWGALLAWAYIGWYPRTRRFLLKSIFYFVLMGLGLLVLIKPVMILYDEVLARTQFPLLAGFESATELSRWHAKNGPVRSTNTVTEGRYSLKVQLLPQGYSGVSMNSFPSDWQSFDTLRFDVWSPLLALPITVRVHDKAHVEGAQQYADRFNRSYSLQKGWNRIVIDLKDILRAPKGRVFNLNEVDGIGLFSYNLGTTETVYLDQVILLRKDR